MRRQPHFFCGWREEDAAFGPGRLDLRCLLRYPGWSLAESVASARRRCPAGFLRKGFMPPTSAHGIILRLCRPPPPTASSCGYAAHLRPRHHLRFTPFG